MCPIDFSDPLTCPLAPPWGFTFVVLSEMSQQLFDGLHETWFRHSCPHQDELQ